MSTAPRRAEITRETSETAITVALDLDGVTVEQNSAKLAP